MPVKLRSLLVTAMATWLAVFLLCMALVAIFRTRIKHIPWALAAAFIEEVPEDAERLRKAVPEKDFYETYQAAHKMKPTID